MAIPAGREACKKAELVAAGLLNSKRGLSFKEGYAQGVLSEKEFRIREYRGIAGSGSQ